MNENQETRSESNFSHDLTGSGVNVSVGTPVNSTKSKLGLILKELREINATLSKLEARQFKLETGQENLIDGNDNLLARLDELVVRQNNLIAGQKVIDAKVNAWFSNL